jgi:hypothetical protein
MSPLLTWVFIATCAVVGRLTFLAVRDWRRAQANMRRIRQEHVEPYAGHVTWRGHR